MWHSNSAKATAGRWPQPTWRRLAEDAAPFPSLGEHLVVSGYRFASGRIMVMLAGELALQEIQGLKRALLEYNLADQRTVIVDLADVQFIDSAGLELLVLLHRKLRESGASLRIVCPELNLRKVFLITELDRELEIHTSLEHALW